MPEIIQALRNRDVFSNITLQNGGILKREDNKIRVSETIQNNRPGLTRIIPNYIMLVSQSDR